MQMKKESTLDQLGLLSTVSQFYKDERGILLFRDAAWTECLCVPQSQVLTLLKETHNQAFKTAHARPARMYWPHMWKEIKSSVTHATYATKSNPIIDPKQECSGPCPFRPSKLLP